MNNQKFRAEVQKTQNILDKTDIRPMADHLDLFQQIYRDWNEEADRLTHEAREKGTSWNSFTVNEGANIEAVRACFDGAVSRQEDRKVKHKVGRRVGKELKKLLRRWNGGQQSKLRKSSPMMPR